MGNETERQKAVPEFPASCRNREQNRKWRLSECHEKSRSIQEREEDISESDVENDNGHFDRYVSTDYF